MVPEVINWEAVRCVSINEKSICFVERNSKMEVVFPTEEALHEALRRWTVRAGEPTEFFRKHDFQSRGS
jgi:hypothetical protein